MDMGETMNGEPQTTKSPRIPFETFIEFQDALNEIMMRSLALDLECVLDEIDMWAMEVREWIEKE